MLHIGIVGCSAEGAALCYRTLCAEAEHRLGGHIHPEISMHTPSLHRYVECLERNDLDGIAALMQASAEKLAAIGADVLICPDNTIHQALARIEPASPRPWLHIARVVAGQAAARGYGKVGILGTKWLVNSDVYPRHLEAAGLQWVRPDPDDRERMNQVIMGELVPGRATPRSTAFFVELIEKFRRQGCDAVALGCTEIPLVIDDGNSPLPTLDSTRLLAHAALQVAIDGRLP